jgi:hypothetical protein
MVPFLDLYGIWQLIEPLEKQQINDKSSIYWLQLSISHRYICPHEDRQRTSTISTTSTMLKFSLKSVEALLFEAYTTSTRITYLHH